ncbi:MAG TPA: Rho termination factor N-terminal domain-containing protein, partial [Mycobacterium sp.]
MTAQTPPAPEPQPAESRGGEQGADAGSTGATGSLSTMVLPELRALANRVGVKGTSGMRKGDLIEAIRDTQNGGNGSPRGDAPATEAAAEAVSKPATEAREDAVTNVTEQPRRERRTA